MKKFMGLILIMGKAKKDTRVDYYITDAGYETHIYSKGMSREWLRQIWQLWHFVNNNMIHANFRTVAKIIPQ